MSSYEIWGGWQNWRKYDRNFLEGNVWRKKGRDHEIWNNEEGNKHPRVEGFD